VHEMPKKRAAKKTSSTVEGCGQEGAGEEGRRPKAPKRLAEEAELGFYLQRWPSARAMRVLRDKVRAATAISKAERPVSAVVADLNPVLRGWGAYFRNGNSGRKFNAVDGYVHERLAILASRKHGLRGRNWATCFTYGWITRLGVYRLTGTVHRATVHASR